jgi:hypothetical protein
VRLCHAGRGAVLTHGAAADKPSPAWRGTATRDSCVARSPAARSPEASRTSPSQIAAAWNERVLILVPPALTARLVEEGFTAAPTVEGAHGVRLPPPGLTAARTTRCSAESVAPTIPHVKSATSVPDLRPVHTASLQSLAEPSLAPSQMGEDVEATNTEHVLVRGRTQQSCLAVTHPLTCDPLPAAGLVDVRGSSRSGVRPHSAPVDCRSRPRPARSAPLCRSLTPSHAQTNWWSAARARAAAGPSSARPRPCAWPLHWRPWRRARRRWRSPIWTRTRSVLPCARVCVRACVRACVRPCACERCSCLADRGLTRPPLPIVGPQGQPLQRGDGALPRAEAPRGGSPTRPRTIRSGSVAAGPAGGAWA